MKKATLLRLGILLFVMLAGYNILLNFYGRMVLNRLDPSVKYSFCFSLIPDRVTFVNFIYNKFISRFVTFDFYITSLLEKKYERAIDGLSIDGMNIMFTPEAGEAVTETASAAFILPFCNYIKIRNSELSYFEPASGAYVRISDIHGKSKYVKGAGRDEDRLELSCTGKFQDKGSNRVYVNFSYFPYYKNRFYMNLYGIKLNAKELEPLLKKYNLLVDSGSINFLVQVKGEKRRISVNNITEFADFRIREDASIDVKELFGVSYRQMAEFLGGSGGNFYVNFNYEVDDSEFLKIFTIYGDKFRESVGNRILLGAVTAPVRNAGGMIWNLTGENLFRIFRIFGGN